MASEFDDLFSDDNPDVVTPNDNEDSDGVPLSDGETYLEKLQREKGLSDPEEIAKSALHGDSHIKKLERENAGYKDWIKNQAGAAVKLAKEYIETDAYKQKYGLSNSANPPGDKPADAKKSAPEVDLNTLVEQKIAERVTPAINSMHGEVSNLSEKELLSSMKQDPRFPYLTEEVEKDMRDFLKNGRDRGQPYPATAVALANLYNSFVGKNIDKVLEARKDAIRKDILKDIAEGNDSYTEDDRDGEAGIERLKGDAEDIAAMFNAHKNPLSFG